MLLEDFGEILIGEIVVGNILVGNILVGVELLTFLVLRRFSLGFCLYIIFGVHVFSLVRSEIQITSFFTTYA